MSVIPGWLRNLLITIMSRRLVRIVKRTLRRGTVREIQDAADQLRQFGRDINIPEPGLMADQIEAGYGAGSIEAFVLEREGVIDREK